MVQSTHQICPLLRQAQMEIARGDMARARQSLVEMTNDAAMGLGIVFSDVRAAAPEPVREAAQVLDAVIPPAHVWRDVAETLGEFGMSDEAAKVWRRARQDGLSPLVAETQTAVAWLVAGVFDLALEILAPLSRAEPRNGVVHNLHAIALLENGRLSEALEAWQTALRHSAQTRCPLSTHPTYLTLGAMALERFLAETEGDVAGANAGMTLETDSSGGSSASADSDAGRDAEAPTAGPDRAPGRTRGARLAAIEREADAWRFDRALSWIEAEVGATERPPEELRFLRAWVLGELGRWAEARVELAGLLDTPAANPSAQSFLALCLIRSGEPALAVRLLETVAPAGPDDFFANYYRGCAHLALNDRRRALHAFKAAFTDFFYDTYHTLVLATWDRLGRRVSY